MLTIRAMSDGRGYSSKHLEHSDYYAEGERVVGRWKGRGADLLGLDGEVKGEEFEALRQACHPKTGEFLRPRQSADRTSVEGTMQSRGRNLYDFTISAPKSVSVMAILGGDQWLLQAHQEAVNEALQELELNAATRVRQGGVQDDRLTGNRELSAGVRGRQSNADYRVHPCTVSGFRPPALEWYKSLIDIID
jgi:conjugative relaxase-like TrwC/TraI family protein